MLFHVPWLVSVCCHPDENLGDCRSSRNALSVTVGQPAHGKLKHCHRSCRADADYCVRTFQITFKPGLFPCIKTPARNKRAENLTAKNIDINKISIVTPISHNGTSVTPSRNVIAMGLKKGITDIIRAMIPLGEPSSTVANIKGIQANKLGIAASC